MMQYQMLQPVQEEYVVAEIVQIGLHDRIHQDQTGIERDCRCDIGSATAANQASGIAEEGEREQCDQPVDRLPGREPAEKTLTHESSGLGCGCCITGRDGGKTCI